jgi:hypothetical protein
MMGPSAPNGPPEPIEIAEESGLRIASRGCMSAIESCEEFGRRLYAEAWQRGWAKAEKKVVLGDGSEWIWNQAALHFPDATHIVDLYHSREHLGTLAAQLYPQDEPTRKRWLMVEQDRLDLGKIEDLVASLRALETSHPGLAKEIETEANYFEGNQERMRYAKFRKQGLFVGSGVVEAGCNAESIVTRSCVARSPVPILSCMIG